MAIKLHEMEINNEPEWTITQQFVNLRTCVNDISTRRNKAKLALYAAKDCFHLNSNHSKPFAQTCITLVESWLSDPDSVYQKELSHAVAAAHKIISLNNMVARESAYAATYASEVVCLSFEYTYAAVNCAIYAFYYHNDYNKPIRKQKVTQYTNYVYPLLRSTNVIPTHAQGKITDKATLMALLDELNELNENLILYQDNKVILNHPAYPATNTLPELVDLIYNDASLLHYLEHLYGN